MVLAASLGCAQVFWGYDDQKLAYRGLIWEAPLADFGPSAYDHAVEAIFAAAEAKTGKVLQPGAKRRVGLKLYTGSGPGLRTPEALTQAVIMALERRGYQRDEIFLIDYRERQLRASGYLPLLSQRRHQGNNYYGVPVYALDSGQFFSERWYYDSPLPRENLTPLAEIFTQGVDLMVDNPETRKSYLPEPLLTGVDFWINLPVITDHPALGLNGVLVNATLWNVSNNSRFFVSSNNAPVAVAEIAAIPELQDTWALNLVSMEYYQFIGGPVFNSYYVRSEPRLLGAVDPVVLDAIFADKISQIREYEGFETLPLLLAQLDYAYGLKLGEPLPNRAKWVKVGE